MCLFHNSFILSDKICRSNDSSIIAHNINTELNNTRNKIFLEICKIWTLYLYLKAPWLSLHVEKDRIYEVLKDKDVNFYLTRIEKIWIRVVMMSRTVYSISKSLCPNIICFSFFEMSDEPITLMSNNMTWYKRKADQSRIASLRNQSHSRIGLALIYRSGLTLDYPGRGVRCGLRHFTNIKEINVMFLKFGLPDYLNLINDFITILKITSKVRINIYIVRIVQSLSATGKRRSIHWQYMI